MALLRHFFFLWINDGHTSGCANFVAAGKANAISKAGKKADGFRSKWVMMDAKCVHPQLKLPTEMPQSDEGWSRVKVTHDRAKLVLEKMNADLKPCNAKAAKLTGAMLLREFLVLRVAPLQASSRPLWMLRDKEDRLHLSPEAFSGEELAVALCLLVGDNQEYPPNAHLPLFLRKDGAQVVAAMPTFD